jgi:hypothetical protein
MKRKLLIGGAGIGLLLVLAAALAAREQRAPSAAEPKRPAAGFEVGIPTAQEVRNMLAVYGERVEGAERELAALRARLEDAQKRSEEARKHDVSALERLIRDVQGAAKPEPPPAPAAPRFRTVEFEKPAPPALQIAAGSFGEATLLTGVFAPVSGEPLPVLLRLDAALVGPQRSRIPLRGAFLVGKAQGETNSRRAVVQLDVLSALRGDGRPAEARVNGWVADDDGIQGLRGHYVWRADEIALLSSLSGGLAGGAQALAQNETTSQVTPLGGVQGAVTGDPLGFAGYRALSSALGRLSDTINQRLGEVVPAIYVPNARRVTVAFVGGATLEGVEPPPPPGSPFGGLDR